MHEKMGKTMVFVTHDMDEAIKIADRICIMRNGHILQFDTPEQILKHPADDFIASFVGTERIWDSPEFIRVSDFMIKGDHHLPWRFEPQPLHQAYAGPSHRLPPGGGRAAPFTGGGHPPGPLPGGVPFGSSRGDHGACPLHCPG